jgi:signal transduction histidine kinase
VRLWVRLLWVLVAITLLPVAVTGGLAWQAAVRSAEVQPQEALAREASTLATLVAARLDADRAAVAGWSGVWDLDDRPDAYRVNLLRAMWLGIDDAVTLALVDANGRAVVEPQFLGPREAPADRTPGTRARAQALLERVPAPEGLGVTFGEPYTPPGGRAPAVPMISVRSDSALRVVAEVALDQLAPAFRVEQGGKGRSIALLDGSRRLVLGSGPPVWNQPDVLDLVTADADLALAAVDADGAPIRGALERVPGTRWAVLVAEPAALAEHAAREIRRQTLVVGWIALGAAVAVGLVIQRLLSGPLHALRDHASAMARGEYARRIPRTAAAGRTDELGDLARALNDMAARLEASRDEILAQKAEIEAFNQQLQRRVEAATADLRAAQDELVRSAQYAAIGEVGAGLAHELNNPLAGLLGSLQLMAARSPSDAAALGKLEQLVQRCRDVVDAMVRFQGGLDGELRGAAAAAVAPVDLRGVLRDAIAAEHPRFEERGVDVRLALPDDPVWTPGPAALLEQLALRWLAVFRAGLPPSASLRVAVTQEPRPALVFETDRALALLAEEPGAPVGTQTLQDDLRAAGLQRWLARRLADLLRAETEEPREGADATRWRVVLQAAPRQG